MTAMLFGTTSSPFLAQYVKNHNAQVYGETHKQAATAIVENHYVDDYLHGAETVEDAIKLINDVIYVHSKGGFEIRNFICNSQEVLHGIPQHFRTNTNVSEVDKNIHGEKVLGMIWNATKDIFSFSLEFHRIPADVLGGTKIPTKREVLKLAMSVYDPLGLSSIITIKVRMLLQNIWRSGIGWDDSISDKMFGTWLTWLNDLKHIMTLEIPRCYSEDLQEARSIELHIFSDSSEDAYASAVYLRFQLENHVEVVLVATKARVTPLKTLTIPKLELIAALMGVRLCKEVMKHLQLKFASRYFWSDSRTVLHWQKSEKKLQTFVASRVGEILEYSNVGEWRWVPTQENVADDCTRNSIIENLSADHRWFKGPQFLYESRENWPKNPENSLEKEDFSEECVHVMLVSENIHESLPKIKSHYSWIKLLRITARIKRFLNNTRTNMNQRETFKFLSVEEMDWSEKQWWKAVQNDCFQRDMQNISNGTSNKNGRLHKIPTFLDPHGIMRISIRIIRLKEISVIQKEPVVLNGNHAYTQKMILHYHKKNGHQGLQTVINELRRRFWIPQLGTIVKKTIRLCTRCKRYQACGAKPKMGVLPKERLLTYEKPFSATGIDYFGPFLVKIGRRLEKRYGVLFTCLTIRAIHVEITHSLSTDSCIMAIRRFLARRGDVQTIWSDNGSNLRGASRELLETMDELEINIVAEDVTNRGIKWRFIPSLSPHMGGSWERMIGCFKRTLVAIMKDRHPTDEILRTLFCEAEYIVNSRPLTNVSTDPQDNLSICPNDLLIGRSTTITAPGLFIERDLILRKQWRISQSLADMFWRRWLREYVPTLIQRKKWCEDEPNLKEGEMVIISDKNLPRGAWPLGVVEKLYKGEDNIVRLADVRTTHGLYKRSARKLYRLNVLSSANGEVSTRGENVADDRTIPV